MDGLDAMMAELSTKKPPAKLKAAAKGEEKPKKQESQGRDLGQDTEKRTLPQREQEFVNRLKQFQLRAADPSTRDQLNNRLSKRSADYLFTMQYYLDRPELAEYTVQTEISRMSYTLKPEDGGPGEFRFM